MTERVTTVLMHRRDVINLKEAAARSGRSDRTLRTWCRAFGIGRQSSAGSPLEISAPALEMVLHGDFDALSTLRAGDRLDENVRRYFDHLGLEP